MKIFSNALENDLDRKNEIEKNKWIFELLNTNHK